MPDGTIVVADDHEPTRRVLAELLRGDGWAVLEARDGVELLELALANRPDAVVTDLGMPRMGGLHAARALRQLPGGAVELLIAITGRKLTAAQEAELDRVFDRVLRKPVSLPELRSDLRCGLEAAEPD